MRIKKYIVALVLGLFATLTMAQSSPINVMQSATVKMIQGLKQNKSRLKLPGVVDNIVRRSIIPYIDSSRMAGMVVGRTQWRRASSAQRSSFVKAFTRLVISTYSAALSSYDNDKVRFYPLRNGWQKKPIALVRSVLIRPSGQTIPISYNLVRSGKTWRIYDFSIENISMVQSYRSQFSSVLASKGLGGLTKRLNAHNSRH